ncbi:MAG: hypothetical protein COB67_12350 [SAR324 cluster bacterium]|uniref:Uncharacterized protein n=1 Tax=SAR324 cluster bacterium TaxID=2024889 RepID=A0A2A4SS01_9DELT|nr:MAG: hypothetical protein COB67_12350 [SAR324 cluster bacterium]
MEAEAVAQEKGSPQGTGQTGKRRNIRGNVAPSGRRIPKDFAARVAIRITAINERELDDVVAAERVADLIHRNMSDPEMYPYFLEIIDTLLDNDETRKYAATTWTALLWHADEHPEYRDFVESLILMVVNGHIQQDRPPWENQASGKSFSSYAYLVGETFIQMMRLNSDLYEILTDLFSMIIRLEMSRDLERKEAEGKQKKNIVGKKKKQEGVAGSSKKLYDDIVDYVSSRGDFRSDTLNQKNPNEYILVLADRMRSTRRYIIQDIMNRYALEKKKKLEKELKEREASAEEVIGIGTAFNHGLYLFWVEKRYNFKYLAVEKVRITLEVLGMLMGVFIVGMGYLGAGAVSIGEGIIVCGMMIAFVKFFCSRQFFLPFYPQDVTADLEKDVGIYTPVFRKMSKMQMNAFLNKHMRNSENTLLLHLMPEYVKYIFSVMPDRKDLLMTSDDINEFIEHLELNISKFQRGR